MQGNLFLILSLLLSSCLAHKSLSSTQSSIDSESKFLSELKSHKMGKILMGLAEITPSGDTDSLLDALDVLESSLEQKIKTQNDLYSNAENLHDSAVGTYKATIESLEIGIADLQQSLNNNLNPSLSQVESDIEMLQNRIGNIQQQIADANSIRNREKSDYEQRNKDLSDATESINEAMSLLSSLVTSDGDEVELVQAQKQNLLQIKNKLQKKLSHIRNSFTYKPIIEALTQITLNDDFVDQKTLKKVISLLLDIKDSLDSLLYDLQIQEQRAETDFENTIQNANDDLDLSTRILKEDKEKYAELDRMNFFMIFFSLKTGNFFFF